MPPRLVLPPCTAMITAFNTAPLNPPSMAARQAVLGRGRAGGGGRRAARTVAESTAAAVAAPMPPGWTPSRFFGTWKKEVAETAGFKLYWLNMGYYMILAPDDRKRVIDRILRTTIMDGYESDDFYEGVLASHGDYAAMQAYAAAFVDAFWADFWPRKGCVSGSRRGDTIPYSRRSQSRSSFQTVAASTCRRPK